MPDRRRPNINILCGILLILGFLTPSHAQNSLTNGTWAGVDGGWDLMGYKSPADRLAPNLEITNTAGTLTISWPGSASDFVLQTTDDPASNSWTVVSNVPSLSGTQFVVALPDTNAQQFFRLKGPNDFAIPVFEFAVFYNSLLEFTWTATMTLNGRVHANSDIFVGSPQNVTFNRLVTTSGGIFTTNWAGHTTGDFTGAVTYASSPGYLTNMPALTLPIGTSNTVAALREIINPPPPIEDSNSPMGAQRYYNKAGLVFTVSDSNVVATLKNSAGDPAPVTMTGDYNSTNYSRVVAAFPFLSLTNQFMDQRENKIIKASQIDIGVLKTWMLTNASINSKFPNTAGIYANTNLVPNICYLADNRTIVANQLAAIRLVNGSLIPTNATSAGQKTGFTFTTPNPLYVKGNYNCPNPTHLGTTNTTATFPASLVSDAITILSQNWTDVASSNSFGSGVRVAASTTVNAAILAGIVFSTPPADTQFSGGLQNVARLLEDWSSTTLTLNSSFVSLFDSARATNQWKMPGNYYYAPYQRKISFNQNFLDPSKLPPGTPYLTLTLPAAN